MFPFLRIICFWTCLLMAGVAGAVPASQDSALDGLTFKGHAGEQGKGEHHEDAIAFEGGVLRAPNCEKRGFRPARYTIRKEGDSYHFAATLQSSDKGVLEWRGIITGNVVTATFRWLHNRWYWDIDRQYWFKGTRVAGK